MRGWSERRREVKQDRTTNRKELERGASDAVREAAGGKTSAVRPVQANDRVQPNEAM